MTIGEFLTKTREDFEISKTVMEWDTGVSRVEIASIESGKVLPTFATIKAICDTYRFPICFDGKEVEFRKFLTQCILDSEHSRKDLIEQIPISRSTLSHYEHGFKIPKLDTMIKICDFLGKDVTINNVKIERG